MNKLLKKSLIKIAHSYGVKCRFRKDTQISYVDVFTNTIVIAGSVLRPSDFFHELGHMLDYRNGLYAGYYKAYPTKKYLRRFAVQAEMHTDLTGNELMKKYYPKMKYVYTYKYKKWQKWLREYWEID